MQENKRLTPTVIIYVDGQRLNTVWEGAFRSLNLNDPLNDIGKARINFVFANPEELDTDIFAPCSNVSILLGYKDDMHEVFNGQALD